TTAGARPGLGGYGAEARDRWLAPPCCTSAGAATRAGGQAATWAGGQAATWAGGRAAGRAAGKDEDNAVLALPGPVVWAGLYWASAGPVPRTSIALRGPDGPYRQVTGTATGSVVDLGVRGLPDVPVYQAFADVTSQVARYGAGAWSTVPLTAPGAAAGSLGWALVAVTEDGAAPPGQVMVLDGARPVDAAQPGFAAPLGGLMAGRSARVHVVEWTEHGPRAASFSQSLAGRPAVRFTPAGSPYLVGVITATGLPLPPASGARPGPQYPLHPVVTAFL